MALELNDRHRAMLQEMGVPVWLPAHDVAPAPIAGLRAEAAPAAVTPPRDHDVQHLSDRPVVDVQPMGWSELVQATGHCQACALGANRKQSTLQAPLNQEQADWFVIGDPPDDDEDRLGAAFSGSAGQLLDNMLKAIGARRGESGASGAYVTNLVKCRPPPTRLPTVAEIDQCSSYLRRELALVRPKVILAMGRLAVQHALSEHPQALTLPLGKQRGQVYRYQGIPVVVTYAPKALLRASQDKAKAWADLCLALDVRNGSAETLSFNPEVTQPP